MPPALSRPGFATDRWGRHTFTPPGADPITGAGLRGLLRTLLLTGHLAVASPGGGCSHVVDVARGRPLCHAGRGAFDVLTRGWRRCPATTAITCTSCRAACRLAAPEALVP